MRLRKLWCRIRSLLYDLFKKRNAKKILLWYFLPYSVTTVALLNDLRITVCLSKKLFDMSSMCGETEKINRSKIDGQSKISLRFDGFSNASLILFKDTLHCFQHFPIDSWKLSNHNFWFLLRYHRRLSKLLWQYTINFENKRQPTVGEVWKQ